MQCMQGMQGMQILNLGERAHIKLVIGISRYPEFKYQQLRISPVCHSFWSRCLQITMGFIRFVAMWDYTTTSWKWKFWWNLRPEFCLSYVWWITYLPYPSLNIFITTLPRLHSVKPASCWRAKLLVESSLLPLGLFCMMYCMSCLLSSVLSLCLPSGVS